MQPPTLETSPHKRSPQRHAVHVLAVVTIIAASTILVAWQRPGRAARTLPAATTLPSPSSDARPDIQAAGPTISDWQKLACQADAARTVAVAVKSPRSIQPDGRIDPEEWADAFRVTAPGAPAGCSSGDLDVRCLWNEQHIAVSVATPMPPDGAAGWRLVLCMDSQQDRFQFDCRNDGVALEYRLTTDVRQAVEPTACRAAMTVRDGRAEVEWLIPAAPFLACLTQGRGLAMTIRAIRQGNPEPRPDDPPLYWFVSTYAAAPIDVVPIDPARLPWPALTATNCLIDPHGIALQWNLPRYDLPPAEPLALPVQICSADAAAESFTLSSRLTDAVGNILAEAAPLVPARAAPSAPRVGQADLRLPPVPQVGARILELEAKVGQASASRAQLALLVRRDVPAALRLHLLQRRDRLEQMKAAPPFDLSVTRAHVVRCLQLIEQRQGLTIGLLRALNAMQTAFAQLEAGQMPVVPLGLSEMQWRSPQGEDIGFILCVPEHYDARLAWPLLVSYTDPYIHPTLISVGITNRLTRPLPSPASLATLVTEVQRHLHIDPDRLYLTGQCEGAYRATDLLVTSPDRWAAAVLAARAKWSALWPNAAAVPTRCYSTTNVKVDQIVTRTAIDWMRRQSCPVELVEAPDLGHMVLPSQYQRQIVAWCLAHSRKAPPSQVHLRSFGWQFPSNCWLAVNDVQDADRVCEIRADVQGDTISIDTRGVTAYTIDLASAPVDQAAPTIRIVENGAPLSRVPKILGQTVFTREPPAGTSTPRKHQGMSGPIASALQRPWLVVWGAPGDTESAAAVRARVAALGRASDRVHATAILAQDQVADQHWKSENLLLIGSADSNGLLMELLPHLPLTITNKDIMFAGRQYDAATSGLILLHPHPFSPERYVLVLAAANAPVLACLIESLLADTASIGTQDVLIGHADGQPQKMQWDLVGSFDHAWTWPEEGPLLATLKQPHPDWQWQQWAADVACRQARAQGIVTDRLLNISAADLAGPIHARQIRAHFPNDWLVRGHFTRASADAFLAPSGTPLVPPNRPVVRYLPDPRSSSPAAADASAEFVLLAPDEAGRTAPDQQDQPLPAWWSRYLETSDRCELQEHFLADGLIQFVASNPGLDLDAVLSAQKPLDPQGDVSPASRLQETLPW